VQLLERLGSGIVPGGEPGPARLIPAGHDFSRMLSQARSGQLETGLSVDVSAAPDLKLSGEQQQRLSAAIDRLAASDAQHALVLLDGLALLADPGARRVTGRADPSSGTPVVGIDSMIRAPRTPGAEANPARPSQALTDTNPFRALARVHAEPSGKHH
jgi:hypothetical protein